MADVIVYDVRQEKELDDILHGHQWHVCFAYMVFICILRHNVANKSTPADTVRERVDMSCLTAANMCVEWSCPSRTACVRSMKTFERLYNAP